MNDRKTPWIAFSMLIAFAAIPFAAAQQKTPAAKPVSSSTRYKNIRVLKDLAAEKLISVMQGYDRSLSVRCDFCHSVSTGPTGGRSGYERDGNPMKAKTREMIRMMNGLNKHAATIQAQATCFMCHHGHPEPETQAPDTD